MRYPLVVVLVLVLLIPNLPAQPAPQSPLAAELKTVVDAARLKIANGKKNEADLAEQIKAFDALLQKHEDEKTDDVAQVLLMKAMLYIQVLDQPEKGIACVQRIKTEFPETKQGKNADQILENIKQQAEAKKIRSSLVERASFPDFHVKDLEGNDLSVAKYRGKVLLIDFWATWCGPCVREFPNVLKAYAARHQDGFEIIGISLDEDRQKLLTFLKDKHIPWPQYFDGKGWANQLAVRFGVNSIPATYLLDKDGKIVAKDLRGQALEDMLADALSKK